MMGKETIALVDDDESIRRALERMLAGAGLQVNSFRSASEFLCAAGCDDVSCVISDLRMPDVDGLQLQSALAERMPHLAIVFITGHADVPAVTRAMKSGAIDFLEKPVKRAELLEAIGRAAQRSHAAKTAAEELAALKRRYARLTAREREVFALVAAGLPNKQVATELGAAEKTIKQHRGVVMNKMQADSLADLVLMADRLGVRASGTSLTRARGMVPAD